MSTQRISGLATLHMGCENHGDRRWWTISSDDTNAVLSRKCPWCALDELANVEKQEDSTQCIPTEVQVDTHKSTP